MKMKIKIIMVMIMVIVRVNKDLYATEVVDIGEDWIKYNGNYDNKNNDKI